MVGEREGSFTNTHRLVQWHDKVVEPPGESRSETWFIYHLGRRLKALYADSDDEKDMPIKALNWDSRYRAQSRSRRRRRCSKR